ncbi:branched-chain amino acid ABC transporter permease [Ramlibacter sp.]|uniref:branched-chain amino acid ABC transporter permease n=1 Tax=Ramlibacter sp. TaxID=1917967 RepID=UPI003D10BC2B
MTDLSLFARYESLVQAWLVMAMIGFSFYTSLRSGAFSVAGVGTWLISAYVAGKMSIAGVSPVFSLLAAAGVSAVIGLGLALVLARLRSLYLAMATLSFVLLVQAIARSWKTVTGGSTGLYGIPPVMSTASLFAVAALVTLLVYLTERGRAGRTLAYMRTDEVLARTLGIHTGRARASAFVLSSVLGGLAGACSAMLFNLIAPDQGGFKLVVDGLTVIVLGGVGGFMGPLLGAALVTAFPYLLGFVSNDWRLMVQGIIIVVMIIYVPGGLVGLWHDARASWSSRRDAKADEPVQAKVEA